MAIRPIRACVTLLLFAGACTGSAPDGTPAGQAQPASVVRTADPAARGYSGLDFPRVQHLADGVFTYEQLRSAGDEMFTTVSMFVVTDEGVLVADGQGSPEETARLVETIARITDRPITHVVVCSDHGDHTGGNSAFPAGAVFLAHPTSAGTLAAQAREAGPDAPTVVVPTELVSGEHVLHLGGREIRIAFLGRAHTGGDLVVHLPAERILFLSEAYLNRVFPAMRSAYPTEWLEMLGRAQAMDVDVFVPGHGFVDHPQVLREELQAYRSAVETVIREVGRLHAEGVGVEEAVTRADFGPLEGWTLRHSQGEVAVRRVYAELDGALPPAG